MKTQTHNHSTLPGEAANGLTDVLRWQAEAGCDVVTDGFFYSRDPVWLAIELTSGAQPGPLCDYFGAGFLVPAPVVRDHLHHERGVVVEHWRAAQEKTPLPVKVVLPGPLSLTALSRDSGVYPSAAALCEAWATLLLAETTLLVEAGVRWIQFDEPAVLQRPNEVRFLRSLLEPIWEVRGPARLLVSTWGAGAVELYAQLHSLPADVVGIDMVSDPALLSVLASAGASQELYLGLARPGGDLPLLSPEFVVSLTYALKRYELETLHLGPACGLSGLPPAEARRVLREIHTTARAIQRAFV